MDTRKALVSCKSLGLEPDFIGKVREIFDLGSELLLVATDRISAFDVVMDDAVPGRGILLTQMTLAWYEHFGTRLNHHLIHADAEQLPEPFAAHADALAGRIMLCHKADRFDVEAVVRGYLAGSGFKDYTATGAVCGHVLPAGMVRCQEIADPIFTPATKADEGHDENIDATQAAAIVGQEALDEITETSLQLYAEARAYAKTRGIIIADTKFEFGLINGKMALIDEMLTPDSSRYWDKDKYEPGREQDSMDKQILRNHLATLDWDKEPPPPRLAPELLDRIRQGYVDIYHRLFPDHAARVQW